VTCGQEEPSQGFVAALAVFKPQFWVKKKGRFINVNNLMFWAGGEEVFICGCVTMKIVCVYSRLVNGNAGS